MKDVTDLTKGFGVDTADGPTFPTDDLEFHCSHGAKGARPVEAIGPPYFGWTTMLPKKSLCNGGRECLIEMCLWLIT
jgi:hypothetical protein